MKKTLKEFLVRGMMFGGFGPIVAGLVLFIIDLAGERVALDGAQTMVMVVSTYLLSFVQAGASVFSSIDGWPVAKRMGIHFALLYVAYVSCYLVNSWIPFRIEVVAIFTAIFVVIYLLIWLTTYFIVLKTCKKLNKSLNI